MKKLLLLSLLAVSATSFAAVTGTAAEAELPVKVRGEVIASTTNLVITPLKNAGVDGTTLEFDFGSMRLNSTQTLEGTFSVKRADDSVILGAKDTIEIGMLTGADILPTAKTENIVSGSGANKPANAVDGVNVNYAVSSNAEASGKEYKGTLTVVANIGGSAEVGNFVDTTQKVAVKITTTP